MDSLALANEQLHLESAYKNFFRDKNIGFSKYKCKHRCKDSYTTNLANGNIVLDDKYIRLPKLGMVKILLHRQVPSDYKLKSVTVTKRPSGRYYASILYEYDAEIETITTEEPKVLGLDF